MQRHLLPSTTLLSQYSRARCPRTPLALTQVLLEAAGGFAAFVTFGALMSLAAGAAFMLPFDTLGYDADAPDAAEMRRRLASFGLSFGGGGATATESSPLIPAPAETTAK